MLLAAALAATGGILIAALAIASGGDEDGTDENFEVAEGVRPLGQIRAGSIAQLATCEDWSRGSLERKRATVVDLREQLSGGGTLEGRPSLSDPEAFEVFERACANDFTEAFQLYKIYFRAAAFSGFDPESVTGG